MPAIKFKKLGVDETTAWDAGKNEKRLKEDQKKAYYEKMYAWEMDDADGQKSDYKFPHHFVSADGDIGKASIKACAAIVASLNGGRNKPDIPEADFEGVYDHAKKHYEEAGIKDEDIPELKETRSEELEEIEEPEELEEPGDEDKASKRFFDKSKIEYRTTEIRALTLTPSGDGEGIEVKKILEGRPIVYNQKALIYEYGEYKYFEQIAPGALDGVDLSNVYLKYNHSDHVPPFASTAAGTLELKTDLEGMTMHAELVNTTQASDIHELVKTGHLSKMSYAFQIADDGGDEILTEDNITTRTIKKYAMIRDVSVVDFPAYTDTYVSARSDFVAQIEARKELERVKEKDKSRKKVNEEQRKALRLKTY